MRLIFQLVYLMGQIELHNVPLANELKILMEEMVSFIEQEGIVPELTLQTWMKHDLFSWSLAS